MKNPEKHIIHVFIAIMIITNAFLIGAVHLEVNEIDYRGPYVDELIFVIYANPDAATRGVITGEVDMRGLRLTWTEKEVLEKEENIEIAVTGPTQEQFHMWINLLGPPSGPLCLTDVRFRRALAYAIDRETLCEEVFGEFMSPVDTWTAEGWGEWYNPNVATYPFNVTKANEILDEAGYLIGTDGWRRTPADEPINLKLIAIAERPDEVKFARLLGDTIRENIKVNLVGEGLEVAEWVSLAVISKTHDIAIATNQMPSLPYEFIDWMLREYHSEGALALGWTSGDELIEELGNAKSKEEAISIAHQLQVLLMEELPKIHPGFSKMAYVYRTDEFDHWVNHEALGMASSTWNYLNVRLKTGEPGGRLRVSLTEDIATQNPYTTWALGYLIMQLVYDPLINRHTLDGLGEVPGLAKSWKIEYLDVDGVPGTKLTFNLVENATWHDGEKFTSEDVKFTLEYLKNHTTPSKFAADVPKVYKVETPDDYTAEVYLQKESYWALSWVGKVLILPKHVWEDIEDPINFDNPNPIGTGPWEWKNRVEGQYIWLERNPDYYHSVVAAGPVTPPPVDYTPYYYVAVLLAIVIIAIGSFYILRARRNR